jgi:hypothetical protein
MATLVFDIETSALPLETFDEAQQEYLFREAEKLTEETERENRRNEIQKLFNLWPFTARVVCIAMVNSETGRGKVVFLNPEGPGRVFVLPGRNGAAQKILGAG